MNFDSSLLNELQHKQVIGRRPVRGAAQDRADQLGFEGPTFEVQINFYLLDEPLVCSSSLI
jgi:hypothetical protein